MFGGVDVEGSRRAQAFLLGMGERATHPQPVMRSRAVLEALKDSEKRLFSEAPWPTDTRKWIERKRKEGLSPRTMQASGALRQILENATPPAGRTVLYDGLLWGLRAAETGGFGYAQAQANVGRNPVRIDEAAAEAIALRVRQFLVGY